MRELSKKERHNVYREVLKNFDTIVRNEFGAPVPGVCEKISVYLKSGIEYVEKEFIELGLFDDYKGEKSFYLSDFDMSKEENTEFRKLVLMFCIEMTRR